MTLTYDNAKEDLKSRLEDYLISKGINTRLNFKCLNPGHEDSNPSMSYDRKRNKVHCFSCGCDYDIIDLIKIDYNISDTGEAFRKGYEMFNIQVAQKQAKNEQYTHNTQHTDNTQDTHKAQYMTSPIQEAKADFTEYYNKCNKRIKETSYLKDRGLSDDLISRFNLGFDSQFNKAGVKEAVIIPTSSSSFVARNIDKTSEDRYRKQGEAQLFNIDTCKTSQNVFIVEGEIDALSIIEAGYNAVALGSTAQVNKFIKHVKDNVLNNIFLLCLDNDSRGKEAQKQLAKGLEELEVRYFNVDIVGDYKDANEALQKDKQAFLSMLKNAEETPKKLELEEYKKNYASNRIKDFLNGIKEKANTPFIPTGFKKLDEVLDGGLFEGLYFIGAISSLGKTTFTLQMADQIALTGQDVLIFSLEMAESELMAKSMSRLTLLKGNDTRNAKTTRGITTYSRYTQYSANEINLINTAVKSYADLAQNIVIFEGQGDIGTTHIREAVEKHIRITGKKPVVIIDYLQIIAPYNERATDKQNTDKAVTELKRISRDNKISIVAISSLNRDNYSSKISMQAFKESGAIEYSSDVLIGLQFKQQGEKNFDIDEAKRKSNDANSPREIELKILKNRNGKTGDTIEYNYYPLFNYFKEM